MEIMILIILGVLWFLPEIICCIFYNQINDYFINSNKREIIADKKELFELQKRQKEELPFDIDVYDLKLQELRLMLKLKDKQEKIEQLRMELDDLETKINIDRIDNKQRLVDEKHIAFLTKKQIKTCIRIKKLKTRIKRNKAQITLLETEQE